ncbi:gene transfer agent family protein [Litorisediminicola beolgyonensis]|uniref:Gene transfer agent family protein n=1 Tax=Litorisediminicola beolgyonensis TaxID=1173614 RepID=A0ABW3ZNH9_9RHOB
MANPWRGETALVIDGETRVMRLTLGALAELEAGLGEDSLLALVERMEAGRFSSRDVLALIVAGLRGGGWQVGPEALISAEIAGGPMGAARAAAELLARAFLPPEAHEARDAP